MENNTANLLQKSFRILEEETFYSILPPPRNTAGMPFAQDATRRY